MSKLSATKRHFSSGAVFTNRLEYDNQFNSLKIFDAKDRPVESYVRDIQDRVTSVTNLEGQTMTVAYGVAAYFRTITRFDGTVVSNDFNGDGLISKTTLPGTTNTFAYLKNGQLMGIANESGTISNSFDLAGRLTNTVFSSALCSSPFALCLQLQHKQRFSLRHDLHKLGSNGQQPIRCHGQNHEHRLAES
ncbi:MAG: hypothetical protein C0404_13330 [Verrucomicrobia bacterium]|nr:hypothetical protein [Verrucomicrobiota bacterium]